MTREQFEKTLIERVAGVGAAVEKLVKHIEAQAHHASDADLDKAFTYLANKLTVARQRAEAAKNTPDTFTLDADIKPLAPAPAGFATAYPPGMRAAQPAGQGDRAAQPVGRLARAVSGQPHTPPDDDGVGFIDED
ncbi:hypothetical protein [Azospirillum argentinense]|uniref:hypothetical protein n=1 Tax=Azospirillum argentinense TaxID=2970906 RepID=UPI0032E04B5D